MILVCLPLFQTSIIHMQYSEEEKGMLFGMDEDTLPEGIQLTYIHMYWIYLYLLVRTNKGDPATRQA